MNYRNEIDGLRAIAILPVIWAHAGLPFVTGGFLGVDVFFVISGFLITSIILREIDTAKFSIVSFYEKRARRILPALTAVVIGTALAMLFVTTQPKTLSDFGDSVAATTLFISNIHFWLTSGYFGVASELSPMLHTWSLAVEEQYYIFFPLLVVLLNPYSKKILFLAVILIFITSLSLAQWGSANSSIANFYLLPTRAWELMAGAIAAIVYKNNIVHIVRKKFSSILAALGLLLIIGSYYLFSPATRHPSLITVIPVLGSVLVLVFAHRENITGNILATKWLAFTGVISYSLYLWHQPILAMLKIHTSLHLSYLSIVCALIVMFVLSYFTWKYIETPFRDRTRFSQRVIFKMSGVALLAMLCLGILFKYNFSIQKKISPDLMARYQVLLDADASHSNQIMFDDGCKFWSDRFSRDFAKRFDACSEKHGKALFIIGGSHGMDLYNAIAKNTRNPFVVSVSRGYCRAHTFVTEQKDKPNCQYEDFKTFSKKNSESISLVLYTQTPDRLFRSDSLHKASKSQIHVTGVQEVSKYLADLKQSNGIHVVMVGMLPPLRMPPIEWDYAQPLNAVLKNYVSSNSIELTRYVDALFYKELSDKGILYVSKFESFKLQLPNDLMHSGKITYSDKRHLSDAGEEIFGKRFIDYMRAQGFSMF